MRRILNQVYDSSFLGGFWHLAKDAGRGFSGAQGFQERTEEIALRIAAEGRQSFSAAVLHQLRIKLKIVGDLGNVPQQGPLLVVSNHPDALLDTVVFTALLEKLRPKYGIIGLSRSAKHPAIAGRLFAVDAMGMDEVRANRLANGRSMLEARNFLKEGGCLGFFPSMGEAAATGHKGAMIDKEWAHVAAGLVMKTNAAFLPVRIEMRKPWHIRMLERFAARRESEELKGMTKLLNAARKCHSAITVCAERAYRIEDLPEAGRTRDGLLAFMWEKANTPIAARR